MPSDIDAVKALVAPLADKAGFFRGRVMAMVTEENIADIYNRIGATGIRAAAEALIRLGQKERKEIHHG